jgi:hypothetical protein
MATVRIGGVYGRWEFLVSGAPLAAVAAAEHLAQPSEVVLTPEVWELIRDACVGTPIGGGWGPDAAFPSTIPLPPSPFVRLDSIHATRATPGAAAPPAPGIDLVLRCHIPGAVLSRLV